MVKRLLLFKEGRDWGRIQDEVQNAVVQVFAQVAQFNWLEPYKVSEQYERRGSGFFINDQGYLITNAHVVNEAKRIWIHLPSLGRKALFVDIIGFCPDRDLALLRLQDKDQEFVRSKLGSIRSLPFGDSDLIRRTDSVMVLGYPLGQYRMKSSMGIVSGRESGGGRTLIQITAPINPGNSGGPLLNMNGEVIGITISMVFLAQNVGYAIPINELKLILDDLYNKKFVRRATLGARFNFASDDLAKFFNNPLPAGLYVNKVFKHSLLEQAGVREGDMLYEFNGFRLDAFGETTVPWTSDKISIHDLVARLNIGDEAHLVIYRNGEQHDIRFTFALSEPYQVRRHYPDYEDLAYEIIGGMVIMQLADNHLPRLIQKIPYLVNYTKMENKVDSILIITHILPGSLAQQRRSLVPGFTLSEVNGIKVQTLDEFRKALQSSIKSNFLTLKTSDNILVAFPFKELLEDEKRLSKDFVYPISQTVQTLLDQVD